MIPKIFWRIWIDDPMPERYELFWKSFRVAHPRWEFRTITSVEQTLFMPRESRELFDAAQTWAGKSDVLRYELLREFGGVYVDTDVECLRPFDDLLDDPRPFAGWEDANMVCPTVMGSPARHPAMDAVLLAAWRTFARNPTGPPNQTTGPHVLTAAWRGRADVRLLYRDVFYPVHWSRKRDLGGPYPEASYAVHHWDAGWLPGGPPQR